MSEETSLANISEVDKMIASLPEVSTIPEARRILALATGFAATARKLYNASDVTTIVDANEDKNNSLELARKGGELRLYAEARLGEIIKSDQEEGRLRTKDDGLSRYNNVVIPSLQDYNITAMESSRAQTLAENKDLIAQVIVDSIDIPTRNAVLKEIKSQEHEEKKEPTSGEETPAGLFDVIVVDPPWPYGTNYNKETRRVGAPYQEWGIDDIALLQIPSAKDCIMWLWTTNRFMHDAYHILEIWGFQPKTILTWFKQRTGVGYWLRGDTEHCILAVSGKPTITHTAQSSALLAKAGRHSEKPDEFFSVVESLCPGSKLEMFARKEREGWASHGNQRNNTT